MKILRLSRILMILKLSVFCFICYSCNSGQMATRSVATEVVLTEQEQLNHFLKVAEELRIKTNTPGVGIAIVNNNKIIYNAGIGYRNVEKEHPVTENTLFSIGSCTKTFTGALAAQLVAEGKIDWQDRIIKYLPDFKLKSDYVTQNVTIQDAFQHFTGLARQDSVWYDHPISRQELYEKLDQLDFAASLRERWDYNNIMYVVLGILEERVAGKSWEDLLSANIFKPLGMNNSFASYKDFLSYEEKSTGYNFTGTKVVPPKNTDNIAPSGSISSTPKDIAQWLAMLVNYGEMNGTPIIAKEQYDHMTEPNERMSLVEDCKVMYYSIGIAGSKENGKRRIGIGGAIDGQSATMMIRPEEGFGVFIMTNHRSDYKSLLSDYAEKIFVENDLSRDENAEEELRLSKDTNLLYELLVDNFKDKPKDKALSDFASIRKEFRHIFSEEFLNRIGYVEFLPPQEFQKAITVFELNTTLYPNSANAFDSLGEAYYLSQKYEQALESYQKALTLNTQSKHAKDMIAKISEILEK